MEQINNEKLEKAQEFFKYMYLRLNEKESLKKKSCHNIAFAYQRFLIGQGKYKMNSTDKQIVKMLRDEASNYKDGLKFTFDNLLTCSMMTCDKLLPNKKERPMSDRELNEKQIYDRLLSFSKFMSNLASKNINKIKPKSFSSYEDAYNFYLNKNGLENDKFLDKSVVQAVKNCSNGSWVEDKELPAHLIATNALIATNRALDAYGYSKMKNDAMFEAEKEM